MYPGFPEDGGKSHCVYFCIRILLPLALIPVVIPFIKRLPHPYQQGSITETLAAALIMLTPWNKDRILVDPFCGSGTFPVEAAMMAANMAPGMNRSFLSEDWKNIIKRKCWYDAMDEANDTLDDTVK